ncbi:MAG: helix-turn-helix domain-containing protein, partial [Chloroflexota bacterium]
DGIPVPLTRAERDILQCLANMPGHVISRSDLSEGVKIRGGRSLDIHVCRLRRKLDDSKGSYIETIPKVGYRLNSTATGLHS